MTEAVDDRVGIMIARRAVPAGESRIRTELDHAERDDRAGKGVAVSSRVDKRIDVAREVFLRIDLKREAK